MTRLSINVNKIATLRNSRGGSLPDLINVVKDIENFGAQGITVHPRPDGRHIKWQDVYDIKKSIQTELNVEGYPSPEFIKLIHDIRPHQVTLVPDAPDVLTSNAGWLVQKNMEFLKRVIADLRQSAQKVSLFIDPYDYQNSDFSEVIATGANAIELYTEEYARKFNTSECDAVLFVYTKAARKAHLKGLQINAGHDLNLDNLNHFVSKIECIAEVSIGHALICDALYLGLEKTVQQYLRACQL